MSPVWRDRDQGALEVRLPGAGSALFTTAATGNLSLAAGAGHEHGRALRDRLCETLQLRWLCASPQVHGSHVTRVTAQTHTGGAPLPQPADGHVTTLAGVGVMVLAADCVPVALGAPGAVGAVHAGWRGLAAGVIEQGVQALRELAGDDAEIAAAIGPCAGPCCYEVGEEVLTALQLDSPPAGSSRQMLDLRALVRRRLHAAGVQQVSDVERCTICDPRLFSHRREGQAAGRQAAIAWLR
jgi:YfiH family protein